MAVPTVQGVQAGNVTGPGGAPVRGDPRFPASYRLHTSGSPGSGSPPTPRARRADELWQPQPGPALYGVPVPNAGSAVAAVHPIPLGYSYNAVYTAATLGAMVRARDRQPVSPPSGPCRPTHGVASMADGLERSRSRSTSTSPPRSRTAR